MAVGLLALLGATSQPAIQGVDQLVRELASDNWADRQGAQQKLVGLGDAALPTLRKAMKSSRDPEMVSRIEEAIRQIDANRLTGPSIVTLDYDNADLKTVLADLSKQAGAPVEMASGFGAGVAANPGTVTIHVHAKPFWAAMKELCDTCNISPRFDNGDSKMILYPGGDFLSGIWQCDGPFMIVARRINESADLPLGPGQAVRRMTNLEIAVAAEPKLTVIGHGYMPRIDEAVDDMGHSLKGVSRWMRFNPMMSMPINADDSRIWMMNIDLHREDDKAKKIARLRGKIPVSIATRFQRWEVPDVLKVHDLSKQFGNCTYSIDSITATPNDYQLRVSATRLSTSTNDASLGVGQIDLLDAKGRPLTRRPFGGGGGMQRIMYNFSFDRNDPNHPAGEPAKLVWKVPVATQMIEVPFDFKNLPLP